MATDGTTSTATEPLNSKQKQQHHHQHQQQQLLVQLQCQPLQSITSNNTHQPLQQQQALDKHRFEEQRQEWSHIWTKRQSPEWKPRRASVATCQQQQYLLQQHQKHRMRSYDNNQSRFNYYQQYNTLTDSSLRNYILQRLQCPLKARHANGNTVGSIEESRAVVAADSLKQESGVSGDGGSDSINSQMLPNAQVEVKKTRKKEKNKKTNSVIEKQAHQSESKKVIKVKCDQVPQCQDQQANSDADYGKIELKSRCCCNILRKQQSNNKKKEEIIQCCGHQAHNTTLCVEDEKLLIVTGQETVTDIAGGCSESRALNLENLNFCTSSSGITDCCLEGMVIPNEFSKRKRKIKRTRIRRRRRATETGGNNATDTNSGRDTNTHSDSNSDSESNSNSNSTSLEPNTETEGVEEEGGEEEEEVTDHGLLPKLATGSLGGKDESKESNKPKLNRSCLENIQKQQQQQQQQHSYLLPELLKDKSASATCCSQTTPSPLASGSTNELAKVTEKPTATSGTNHGIIQELELQDKQRKSLIFSMALKKLISDSKLVSECYNCHCSRKSNNNNSTSVLASSTTTASSSSSSCSTSYQRFRRTGNNKVNLSRAATCEESEQTRQQRSVSGGVLANRTLVSSAGELESLAGYYNSDQARAESEQNKQARSVVELARDRRSSEETFIGRSSSGKNKNENKQEQQQQQQQQRKQQLSICARCYHRQKSHDNNFGLDKDHLKQHQLDSSHKMTRNLKQEHTTTSNNSENTNNINTQQDSPNLQQQQQQQQQQGSIMLSQPNESYCLSQRKSTTSIELTEDNDCDLESLIVESWLDDHPDFVQDYFKRKANHQLIDDWLITHAKVSNTSLKSSQLDLMVNLRSSESRISQNSLNNNNNNNNSSNNNNNNNSQNFSNSTVTNPRSESESPTSGLLSTNQTVSPCFLSTRSDSQLSGGGSATPVRKISATDFESRTGNNFLRPMVSTTPDGKPTFLSQLTLNDDIEDGSTTSSSTRKTTIRASNKQLAVDENNSEETTTVEKQQQQQQQQLQQHSAMPDIAEQEIKSTRKFPSTDSSSEDDNEVTRNDEVKLIFELVKNICNDLDIRTLLHKILKNIAVLINADKSSLFLVCGKAGDPNRHLVSQLFNVDQDDSELLIVDGEKNNNSLKDNECIRIPWGTGLVGYVAESGESINIENCYDDPRFTNTVDQRTGYITKHMLCAPIFDKRNEIVGVAQVINKRDGKAFSKSDEIKFKRYLQFCGIGLRNAQSYEHCQLENKRNQVLLDLARMVFEEQSTIEQVVYRIMLHTQSLLECQRCQVLLIDDGSDDLDQLLQFPNSTLGGSYRSSTWSWLGNQARQQQQQQQQQQSTPSNDQNVTEQQRDHQQTTAYQSQIQSHHDSQKQSQQQKSQQTPQWRPHCGQDLTANRNSERQANTNYLSTSTSTSKAQTSSLTKGKQHLEGESEVVSTRQQQHQRRHLHPQTSLANNNVEMHQNETNFNTKETNASPTKLFSLVFDLECDGNDLVMHSNKSEKSTMTTTTTTTATTTTITPQQSSSSSNSSSSSSTSSSAISSSSATSNSIATAITTTTATSTSTFNNNTTANLDAPNNKSRQFPINFGITGYVAMTGETLNIECAHEHERFDPSVDEGSNFKHKSILCMPIRNGQRKIIGVSQLINKKNGRPFNKNDEDLFEAFAIFCGLGIHNTLMYEKVLKIMAKQRVTFEVLSYHATAPLEEAKKLNLEQIPSCFALNLTSLKFNDFSLDEQFMLKACLRFFLDLDLMRRFQIDQLVFCNWILSVQKNYRKVTYHPIVGGTGLKAAPVRYHNWRHAFNVSQMMFAILINTQICQALGELETLALLIACLCHDLDHRGTNNSFQIKSASPLAELYSTSTMEHHHFDQCVMILNSQGNQILANLSPQEYSRVIVLLEEAILATDLANYFQKREIFFQLVNSDTFDWHNNLEHRSLLRCMLMTACDVAAITKPWSVQKVVADLVMSEFYQQGDIERQELNIEPIDMMNRDKMSKLPEMQIGFIDSICAPIYAAFAKLFPHELGPLLEGCLTNRDLWTEVAKNNNNNTVNLPNSNENIVIASTSETTANLKTNLLVNQAENLIQCTKQQTLKSPTLDRGYQSLCAITDDQSQIDREFPLSALINKQSHRHCSQSINVDCQRKSV